MKHRQISVLVLLTCLFITACGSKSKNDGGNPLVVFAADFKRDYPLSEAQDFYKSLFQETFGPGHIIASWEGARMGLESEIASMSAYDEVRLTEPCGPSGLMLRLNLRKALSEGMTVDTILMLMRQTTEQLHPDTLAFLRRWDEVRSLAANSKLPWTAAEIEELDATLSPQGLDVIHHSHVYAMNYYPAYRVILTSVFREWEERNGKTKH